MVEEKPERSQDASMQDVTRVLNDAANNLIELDSRLQKMRRDITGLIETAAASMGNTQPGGGPSLIGAWSALTGQPSGAHAARSGAVPTPASGAGDTRAGTTGAMPATGQGALAGMWQGAWSVRDFRARPPLPREPSADLVDAGAEFVLQLELPGVRNDDLDIMATDRAVVVTAEYRPDLEDGGVVVLGERGPITYRRAFPLPMEIQTKECQARLKDGLLTIKIPKKSPTDGAHHVNVAYS